MSKELHLLYEDQEILVINKPSGLPSCPLPKKPGEDSAITRALIWAPALSTEFSDNPIDPGLLNRIDTGTSGILVIAKKREAFAYWKSHWKTESVKKIYRAVAPFPERLDELKSVPLCLWMGHDQKSSKRMRAFASPQSAHQVRGNLQPTWTQIRSVELLESAPPMADWEIEIRTGVLHQIRCSLAWLKTPILGDSIYRGAPSERLWLHAWKLELRKKNQEILSIEAPLPQAWPT
jgi:23S rRNA-/tRNA-specific pseudouridylate synthase